jgi:hypothetical protein
MVRKLRVLRIDDNPDKLGKESTFEFVGPAVTGPTGRDIIAIKGLSSAVQFWRSFAPGTMPDIILCDVDFEHDHSTPLKWAGASATHIPTGLSHIKPFAAMARLSGRPLVLTLHTYNDGQWKALLDDTATGFDAIQRSLWEQRRLFGLLAAHEIIELAEILEESTQFSGKATLGNVWNWLTEHTQSTAIHALNRATKLYRKKLVDRFRKHPLDPAALRVPTGEGIRLRNWCAHMVQAPQNLAKADIGLTLLYSNGTTDQISFVSLFADCEGLLDGLLPEKCFATDSPTGDIWDLKNGLPQIGKLVSQVHTFDSAFADAVSALAKFPLGIALPENAPNIDDMLNRDKLAGGLAVLFRIVDIYYSDECAWDDVWNERVRWDPVNLAAVDDITIAYQYESLPSFLGRVVESVRKLCAEEEEDGESLQLGVTAEDIADVLGGRMTPSSAAVHLEWLTATGTVERIQTGGSPRYKVHSGGTLRRLQRPKGTAIEWKSDDIERLLRTSLGYRLDDHASVGRLLWNAFMAFGEPANANQQRIRGNKLLEDFLNGDAPQLAEPCRAYALANLRWNDKGNWPACLQAGG